MSKKTTKKDNAKNVVEMPLVNPHAAGIDVGDAAHAVAVPEGASSQRVRTFGTMTCNLIEIILWLKESAIKTVAIESTGIYWKPLFSMLTKEGFEGYLVNSKHVKNVTGRKTDEDDAMWIQKLHSCGLLKSSFLPETEQETLRTLVRYRKSLTEACSRFINRMQKSMELMNIKFHTVISNITGKTGRVVIEAIMAGERNAANLLPLIDGRQTVKKLGRFLKSLGSLVETCSRLSDSQSLRLVFLHSDV
jgi:transposase